MPRCETATWTGTRDHGDCWIVFAVYPRPAVEQAIGHSLDAGTCQEELEQACDEPGYPAGTGGPGGVFYCEPAFRWNRSRVLVTQRGGLDI